MRARSCILVASSLGAGGALLLAADLYRRLNAAENAVVAGSRAASDLSLFFGMVHVLGMVALACLFLTIFLLTSLSKTETGAVPLANTDPPAPAPRTEPAATPETEVVPDDADTPAAPLPRRGEGGHERERVPGEGSD